MLYKRQNGGGLIARLKKINCFDINNSERGGPSSARPMAERHSSVSTGVRFRGSQADGQTRPAVLNVFSCTISRSRFNTRSNKHLFEPSGPSRRFEKIVPRIFCLSLKRRRALLADVSVRNLVSRIGKFHGSGKVDLLKSHFREFHRFKGDFYFSGISNK